MPGIVSSSRAVESSPVTLHLAMLPVPTWVTGPDATASKLGAERGLASVGDLRPESSRQVETTRTLARARNGARRARSGGIRRAYARDMPGATHAMARRGKRLRTCRGHGCRDLARLPHSSVAVLIRPAAVSGR